MTSFLYTFCENACGIGLKFTVMIGDCVLEIKVWNMLKTWIL